MRKAIEADGLRKLLSWLKEKLAATVKLTGDQSIAGNKTFTNDICVYGNANIQTARIKGIDMDGEKIIDLSDPMNPTDAANKKYVDKAAVSVSPQSLTPQQQQQARSNLGVSLASVPLVYSPHTWTPNTVEHNFGDGTFGRRFTGTITAGSNVTHSAIISAQLTALNTNIISHGGQWQTASDVKLCMPYAYVTLTPTQLAATAGMYLLNTGLHIITTHSAARANAPYDIWVRYTKV